MDYNLYPVFVEVMRYRNISKAASVLGLTQSAASNALNRLRYALGDQLFIRASRGVVPTEFAKEIAPRIETAVEELRTINLQESKRDIELSTLKRRFRIVASDLEECLLIPRLVEELGKKAPSIQIEVRPYNRQTIRDEIQLHHADFVFAYLRDDYSNIVTRNLLFQDFCCAVRKNHPTVKDSLNLEKLASLKHILVSPDKGGFHGVVDDKLRDLGLKREVVIVVPHFLSGCQLCSVTDYMITLPRFLAEQISDRFNLTLFELPFKMEGFTIGMHWHKRLESDPEHQVIRKLIEEVINTHYHTLG